MIGSLSTGQPRLAVVMTPEDKVVHIQEITHANTVAHDHTRSHGPGTVDDSMYSRCGCTIVRVASHVWLTNDVTARSTVSAPYLSHVKGAGLSHAPCRMPHVTIYWSLGAHYWTGDGYIIVYSELAL